MIRKRKNESTRAFATRLASAREVAVDAHTVVYVKEHLEKGDPVKAIATLLRGLRDGRNTARLAPGVNFEANTDLAKTQALVAAELVKLAIDFRAECKEFSAFIKAQADVDPAQETAPTE